MKSGIIELEGINSSINSTQARMLAERLEREGHKVKLVSFPAYHTTVGRTIASYLTGFFGSQKGTVPEAAALFFALDRYQFKTTIEEWITQGNLVIADRYTYSNVFEAARQPQAKRAAFLKWVEQVEANLPKAKAIVLLDIDAREAFRIAEKVRVGMRPQEMLEETRKVYLATAKKYKWPVIECSDSRGKQVSDFNVHEHLYEALKKRGVI